MELIRGIHNLRPRHHQCVLTIGNFDGVHRGHQALLRYLCEEGRRRQRPVMVMIFEPQPQEYFVGREAPARLTLLRDKIDYLAQSGIDYLLCARFDAAMAAMTAEQFIRDVLVDKLDSAFLVVGDDFRFGARRQGDFALLCEAGERFGFEVMDTETFCCFGQRISSTAIRQALAQGDLARAETLLGHPYTLSGRVVHGDALGRTIGFPTANIPLRHWVLPVKGVYAVEVYGLPDAPRYGVANIGTRPTLAGKVQQLEVHLLDYQADLYGQHLKVVLRKKIRDEQRFASLESLKAQIVQDVTVARTCFGTPHLNTIKS